MRFVPPPGQHGGDGAAVAAALGIRVDDLLDLSASMNPLAPDPTPTLRQHLDSVGRYPDAHEATAALADAIGVDISNVLLTNGGSEAINLLAAEIGGRVEEPEFALHPRASVGPRWRSNPHNPTGLLAGAHDAADVWDEAFYPLAAGAWTRADSGVPVVGSLTKVFACPGLRIGYLLADAELVNRCRARQPTWSVNGLACAALPDLLASAQLPEWSRGIAELRTALMNILAEHGWHAAASDANWVLVDAPGLRERLAPLGILLRDCASFGLPGIIRIAVPDPAGLERLTGALNTVHLRSTP